MLLITFDFSTVSKCAESSVAQFGIIVADLLALKIRSFVILPQSTKKKREGGEGNPILKQKKNKADRKADFLNLRRFWVCSPGLCSCPLRLSRRRCGWLAEHRNSSGSRGSGPPRVLRTGRCSVKPVKRSGALGRRRSLINDFLKCGFWWMLLLRGGCRAFPASVENCPASENKCRMDFDKSPCT